MRHLTLLFAALLAVAGEGRLLWSADPGAVAGTVGALSVSSDPAGATVYVDGRFVGQTPVNVPNLPTGDHRVRVVKDGYLENGRIVKVTGDKAERLQVRLTARAQAGAVAEQPAALKIVVLAGEDGVNIIDKKTAVAPVVEVRDRNDLPVAGASVTFAINGRNSATFANGLRQLTLATDSAGRATVSGLNPVARGTFQIQVRATFQSQIATATIHQTNFATAAAAAQGAAAGGSGAGGAAAGGGGGLSAAAIGGIVAAAGGAVATAVVVKDRATPAVCSNPDFMFGVPVSEPILNGAFSFMAGAGITMGFGILHVRFTITGRFDSSTSASGTLQMTVLHIDPGECSGTAQTTWSAQRSSGDPTPQAPGVVSYAGTWSGQTGQGKPITFFVTGDRVIEVTFRGAVSGG